MLKTPLDWAPRRSAMDGSPPYGGRRRLIQTGAALAFASVLGWSRALSAKAPVRIVTLGDSLSAGYLLAERDSFPAALERALRQDGYAVEVSNAGVSGDTASAGLERLDWAIGDGADLVILELGANDMLRGLDPDVTRKALAGIVEKLKARGIKVLLAGMIAAPGMGKDYETRFNAIYPDLAKQFGVPLYPFFLQGVAGEQKLQLPDGMHPNPQGVEAIVRNILPSVKALLPQS